MNSQVLVGKISE